MGNFQLINRQDIGIAGLCRGNANFALRCISLVRKILRLDRLYPVLNFLSVALTVKSHLTSCWIHHAIFVLQNFAVFEENPSNQKWVNLALAAVLPYRKFFGRLLSHHSSCVNYLHQIPLKLDISARIYVITTVHWLWHR